MTAAPRIKPTSTRCHSAWQPKPGRGSTYRRGDFVQTSGTSSLDHDVREALAPIPVQRRKVISTHDAFGYFAAAYDITFAASQGVSTETEPSARDIATIITQIKKDKILAVFLENVSDPRLMRQIATETGAAIGGTLYSDSLTKENGEAPSYIEMVRHNIRTIAERPCELVRLSGRVIQRWVSSKASKSHDWPALRLETVVSLRSACGLFASIRGLIERAAIKGKPDHLRNWEHSRP